MLLASVQLAGDARAQPAPAPEVELLTMGAAETLYSRFGHAAFLVRWPSGTEVVFNYGYTNFDDNDLVWSFLRGRARFWVARATRVATVRDYMRQDRSVFRQPLRLTRDAARRLAGLLVQGARKENRYYVYHHFHDNCSTRLRDLLDRVVGGTLGERLRGQPGPDAPLRDLVRRGFAGRLDLLLATDLFLGRTVDRRLDRWAAAFLPRVLRDIVADARVGGAPLAGPVKTVYHRKERSPFDGHDPLAGLRLLWLAAVIGIGLAVVLVLGLRRGIRWAGLAMVPPLLVCGLCGLLVWPVVALSTLPELRLNELVFSLWPLDLLLLVPAVRWLRGRLWAGGLLRGYLILRLVVLVGVALGHAAGLLVQTPRAWPVLSAALALGAYLAARPMRRGPSNLGAPAGSVTGGGEYGHQATDAAGPLPHV